MRTIGLQGLAHTPERGALPLLQRSQAGPFTGLPFAHRDSSVLQTIWINGEIGFVFAQLQL
jgi:hypothetical protein